MRPLLPLVLLLALAGCKGGREKDVVGAWTSSGSGMKIAVSADKSFQSVNGPMTTSGTWSIKDDDVTFTPTTLNAKPIAELKARLAQNMGRIPASQRPTAELFLKDMDKPNVLTLSSDGKTMTTNKAKDTNVQPWSPLTKG